MRPTAAPDLLPGLDWLNTTRPLSLADLAGKIVLLSFRTFSCANCMRFAPEIRRLREEHPALVVIGVHAPGLEPPAITGNFSEAIRRSGADYPIAVDRDHHIWQAFGVRGWPTFVLIDPEGNVAGMTTGEGISGRLGPAIGRIEEEAGGRGVLAGGPIDIVSAAQEGALYQPGKVAADHVGMRLFISDAGHNRIVVAGTDGRILDVIGSGAPGNVDGSFREAAFYRPEGFAFDEPAGILYVADAGNHTIRKVSWPDRTVTTIAGTGLSGTGVALDTPRDIVLLEGYLYIAMAGANQIWRMNLATHEAEPYAGTGREALTDGPLREAAFARPSGIATDGDALYVADSGASAIRRIKRGMVETRIGHSLEDYGDLDTIAGMARLHHPAGLAYHQGQIYIADTDNHKIKEYDPDTGWVLTRAGSGGAGSRDGLSGDAMFNAPEGLVAMEGLWYIADTGSHAVRVYDPARHVVSTMTLWV